MSEALTIADDMVVSIAYTMKVDGQEVENAPVDDPLVYLHGAEEIVPGLETALNGKKVGDKFSITLQPADAYGDYDEEDIVEFDLEAFPDDEEIAPGLELWLEDDAGDLYEASVKSIEGDVVIVDMNPLYAGKVIDYEVEVVAIRRATPTEIQHGHVHYDGDDDHE